MAKASNTKHLTKSEQEDLFLRFARCLASLKGTQEAASFMRDLFSEQEIFMLARRLQIADLLCKGLTYEQIHQIMKVGDNTIAKVQLWLDMHGEGFRRALARTKTAPEKISDHPFSWKQMKRKYPLYYWPQLLLEEVIKSARKKDKKRLEGVLLNMKEKSKLSKDLLKLLRNQHIQKG